MHELYSTISLYVFCAGILLNDSAIRLVGANSYSEGRVEVLYNGVWGTICSDGWNNDNSDVVCRSLGFPRASRSFPTSSRYGRSSGPIWLDNVMCNGNEASLVECSYPGVGMIEGCTHAKDVGVKCSGFQSTHTVMHALPVFIPL